MSAAAVVFDALNDNERWIEVGRVHEADALGSISANDDDGTRQIYMFGWHEGDVGVYRSVAGFDVENPVTRYISSQGFEEVSDLAEPFVLRFKSPSTGLYRTIRWSLS